MNQYRKAVRTVADQHTIIARKMYHWYTTENNKQGLHSGLLKNCLLCKNEAAQ